MDWYAKLIRPWLFRLEAEEAHDLMLSSLALLPTSVGGAMRRWSTVEDPALGQELWGRRFANPVGLAAGLDKNGVAIEALASFGFSHIEIGTITAQAQPGNPQPRLFRLPEDEAIINRMGFNNQGALALQQRLRQTYAPVRTAGRRPGCILGINLGKSKIVELSRALDDYRSSVSLLAPWADYLVINVSSPNTPGLRDLQEEALLRPLLEGVREELDRHGPRPLLLKLSPDLSPIALDATVDTAIAGGIDGLILSNTTIARDGLHTPPERVLAYGAGGLSGAPLGRRAAAVLSQVAKRVRRSGRTLPLIGVGGIDSEQAAWQRICLGANLVQVYSGLIYHGPSLVRRINRGLSRRLAAIGLTALHQAVGRDL